MFVNPLMNLSPNSLIKPGIAVLISKSYEGHNSQINMNVHTVSVSFSSPSVGYHFEHVITFV